MLLKKAMQEFPHACKAIEYLAKDLPINFNSEIPNIEIYVLNNAIEELSEKTLGELFGDTCLSEEVNLLAWQVFVTGDSMTTQEIIDKLGKIGYFADCCLDKIVNS